MEFGFCSDWDDLLPDCGVLDGVIVGVIVGVWNGVLVGVLAGLKLELTLIEITELLKLKLPD